MTDAASLTAEEARERAALVEVQRYDVEIDLLGLLDGPVWAATSTTTFTCREPGATTFVDCVGDVVRATLNGTPLGASRVAAGRIELRDLAADNVLVVSSTQSDTASGRAVRRTVDPSDGLVYVSTSFPPDGARRAWACFDQPDLKAPHRLEVCAPASWQVAGNGAPESVQEVGDGVRRWSFPDTPRLPTYVVALHAGPFVELRRQRGGHSLGLWCRQSVRPHLERDAEELLGLTEQGLAFFAEQLGRPFPQERYDQVFVPDLGGAVEGWGCVTCTDAVLHRSPPTWVQRAAVARVLLHEMAHMWFGDLVTLRWWDDLWLQEAFATWAASWAAERATTYRDDRATVALGTTLTAYQLDMGPARHPVRSAVPDVARARAHLDTLTCVKGSAVIAQLVATVGEEAFLQALRAHLDEHAWGNATLEDLVGALSRATGRDLGGWIASWVDRAGTDTLSLVDTTLLAVSPDRPVPRTHRLDIGCYMIEGEGLRKVRTVAVQTTGTATPLGTVLPDADLYLLDESDLTFASVRTDETSLEVLLADAAALRDPLARAVAVATGWDMLLRGELSTGELLGCVLGVLEREQSPALVEPLLGLALQASEEWTPTPLVPSRLGRLAEVARRRAGEGEHRVVALRALAACALTEEHLELLDAAALHDPDLAWRVLRRRAALGRHDPQAVEALRERDPDPDGWVRALAVTAAQPEEQAKQDVWDQVLTRRAVPAGAPVRDLAHSFWQPAQQHLLAPWAQRYLDEVETLAGAGLLRAMMPRVGDAAFLDRARAVATGPGADPAVRAVLLDGADRLARALRARS